MFFGGNPEKLVGATHTNLSQPARVIARELGLARLTVSAVLCRQGLGPQRAIEPPAPVCRYERRRPGDLLHLDTKKLGRFSRPGHRVTGSRADRDRGAGYVTLNRGLPMLIEIRRAEPSEFEGICETLRDEAAYSGTLRLPYPSAEIWRKRLADPGVSEFILVAFVDGQMAGNAGLHHCGPLPRRSHAMHLGITIAASSRDAAWAPR